MSKQIRQAVAEGMSKLGINIQPHDNFSTIVILILCTVVAFGTYVIVRWGGVEDTQRDDKTNQIAMGHHIGSSSGIRKAVLNHTCGCDEFIDPFSARSICFTQRFN